jgi:hypothetical protein
MHYSTALILHKHFCHILVQYVKQKTEEWKFMLPCILLYFLLQNKNARHEGVWGIRGTMLLNPNLSARRISVGNKRPGNFTAGKEFRYPLN